MPKFEVFSNHVIVVGNFENFLVLNFGRSLQTSKSWLKSSKSYGQKPLGDHPSLNNVHYSNEKFPYPRGKLYSEFPTPRAVQSGKSPTLSLGGPSGFDLIAHYHTGIWFVVVCNF